MVIRKLFLPSLCSLVLLVGTQAQQASALTFSLAKWNFEGLTLSGTGTTRSGGAADSGAAAATSSSTSVHANSATTWSTPVGNGSSKSWSANTYSLGDYFEFQVDGSTQEQFNISWDQTRSATGPASWELQWSINGSTFTTFASYTVPVVTWSSTTPEAAATSHFSYDLSSVTQLNNDSSIYFRLRNASATGATAGTGRIDNVDIQSIPEPATCMLLLFGLAGMATRRRL